MWAIGVYLVGMMVSAIVMTTTIFLPDDIRIVVWAIVVVGWTVGGELLALTPRANLSLGVTDSMVERFRLFTIIVLGEAVVGVVDGLSGAERDVRTRLPQARSR